MKKLIEIIKESARDSRVEFELSRRGIKSLPTEIGQLTKLMVLGLFENRLTTIPNFLQFECFST